MANRRAFIVGAGASLAALVLLPPRTARAAKKAVKLDSAPDLKEVGGSVIVKLGDTRVLIIRDAEDAVHAVSPECKHKKCDVRWDRESGFIKCKCHGSRYDVGGVVQNGPAKENLDAFPAELKGERVVITLPE